MQARRPRYDTDDAERRQVTEKFLAACSGGDLNEVMALLAPDVTAWSDGGGKVRAARRPVYGPDHVARWLLGVLAKPGLRDHAVQFTKVNGQSGALFGEAGRPTAVLVLDLADGRIQGLRVQLNPDKLRAVAPPPRQRLAVVTRSRPSAGRHCFRAGRAGRAGQLRSGQSAVGGCEQPSSHQTVRLSRSP